jgi:histone deacetylase 1/2
MTGTAEAAPAASAPSRSHSPAGVVTPPESPPAAQVPVTTQTTEAPSGDVEMSGGDGADEAKVETEAPVAKAEEEKERASEEVKEVQEEIKEQAKEEGEAERDAENVKGEVRASVAKEES